MNESLYSPRRREFIQKWMTYSAALAGGTMLPTTLCAADLKLFEPGRFAEELTKTPPMVEGPFYPDKLPLDTDNDLLVLNDSINPAVGSITHFSGKIVDTHGNPVRNAKIEIWQCDANGVYLHSRGGSRKKMDKNFQGFGRFTTGKTGEYYFRTILPVTYPGRTPHIHIAVYQKNKRVLTTQCLIKGHQANAKDGLYRRVPAKQKELVLADFVPIPNSKIGELTAKFDVVIGATPDEKEIDNQPKAKSKTSS